MTYYPDLTKYQYSYDEDDQASLNVGWLGESAPFSIGEVEDEAIRALASNIHGHTLKKTRGIHLCNICPRPSPDQFHRSWPPTVSVKGVGDIPYGNGEIRVAGLSGILYASPTMIIHYIVSHRYLPPDDYLDGLLKPSQ